MSTSNIIIRLQNLPNEARAMDIRHFFSGLNIPDGGVHVVGGEKGDAFINFSSDDDARQAMMRTGHICGNAIRLFLSSRTEMQAVIAQVRAAPITKNDLTSTSTTSTVDSTTKNDSNSSLLTKLPTGHALNSLLAEFQAKTTANVAAAPPVLDPNNALLLGASPLAIQQLWAALNEKATNNFPTYPFQLPLMNNPLQNFVPSSTGTPTNNNNNNSNAYLNALQQQQQQRTGTSLAFPNQNSSIYPPFGSILTSTDEPYVRIRNIPVGYSYYHIKLLFSKYKLNLSDIKIINDQNGQRTGEIVVRLHTHQDLNEFLSQDGRIQCFNSMLDIKKIDEYTFASAIDSFIPAHVKKTPGATVKNCIRVTGLPKKYERKDVKRFFAGCNVTNRPGGIFIEADTVNGPTFVEFETEIDAEKAFFYNNEQIGSSIIEMYRMTKADMENEINSLKRTPTSDRPVRRPPLLSHEPISGPLTNSNDSPMICLRMKNIPYTTFEQQIYEYFGSVSAPVQTCKILRDRFNRGAGEALVRFPDPQSCQHAYETRNRQIFHGRSLDLRFISTFEYENTPIQPMLTVNDLHSSSNMNQHFQSGPMKRQGHFSSHVDDDRRQDKRARWENQKEGNYPFHRNSQMKEDQDEHSTSNNNNGKMSSTDHRSSTSPNRLPQLPAEFDEYLGRILFLSNVAYRATREEILDFLRPYAPIADTLKIRCDANGKPTGMAVVACETTSDASRALADLNNQKLMDRKIFLQLR